MASSALACPAFAKINLFLELLGPRADGFTEIRTAYQTVTLHDTVHLRLRRRGGVTVRVPGGGAPEGRGNLVWHALTGAARLIGYRGGIEAIVEKTIPSARGLGGGSADAAAALAGLFRLTRTRAVREAFRDLARRLGSDVPFFLEGGCALGVGRGEEVYPLPDLGRRWCVVVAPAVEIPTGQAYRWARRRPGRLLTARFRPATMIGFGPFQALRQGKGNEFEPVVFPRYPVLRRIVSVLRAAGAEQASLSGSGSSVFGLFRQQARARRAAVRAAGLGAVFVVETLARDRYRSATGWE